MSGWGGENSREKVRDVVGISPAPHGGADQPGPGLRIALSAAQSAELDTRTGLVLTTGDIRTTLNLCSVLVGQLAVGARAV